MPVGLHHSYHRMIRVENWGLQWGFYGHLPVDYNFHPLGRGPNLPTVITFSR